MSSNYLTEVGIAGLVQGCLGVLGLGALLGALLGDSAVKAAMIVVVLLALLGLLLVLATSRARWRRRSQVDQAMLRRYCQLILKEGPYWRVTSWQQTVSIGANGDSTISVTVCGVAERDRLPGFRLKLRFSGTSRRSSSWAASSGSSPMCGGRAVAGRW